MNDASIRILIDKAARRLYLYAGGAPLRGYPIVIGRNNAADKQVEGDAATPLGEFYVCAKNPRSKFFLSLCLSYPNIEDAKRGIAANLIDADEQRRICEAIESRTMPPQHTRLGGEIYIHGQAPTGPVPFTRGCIALDNIAMREIYEHAALSTPVIIVTRVVGSLNDKDEFALQWGALAEALRFNGAHVRRELPS